MTTLGALKAEIAGDLDRPDLVTTSIPSEISRAIRHYQATRFYFNESRDETFPTVAAQKLYSSSDDAAIPLFIEVDQIYLMDGTEPTELEVMSPKEWEILTASGTDTGKPERWCYFDQKIGLYPIPDAIYTVRIIGQFMKAGPATNGEANNVWMTEAYELLRARVTAKLSQRVIRDFEMASARAADEREERDRLISETASRVGTGFVTPTEF